MDIKVNYYEILGVDISADLAEIKSSYRKLARQYHPDVCGNDEENVAKFKKISIFFATKEIIKITAARMGIPQK